MVAVTPTPQHHSHACPRDGSSEPRYLARTQAYELALLMPPPPPPCEPPAEPLVRLRFRGEQVEVMLTLATLVAFSADMKQLQEYLQSERICCR